LHEDVVFKDFLASTVSLQNPKLKEKLGDTMGSITSKPSKPKAAASNASLSAYISVESPVAKNSLQFLHLYPTMVMNGTSSKDPRCK
jgi:hypothetical protein